MPLPSLSWIAKVGESAARLIPVVGTITGFFTLIFDLGERIVAGGINYLLDGLDAIDTSTFDNASFGAIAMIGYGNAVFPLEETMSVGAALIAACTTIATIRWAKSFIPTVSN